MAANGVLRLLVGVNEKSGGAYRSHRHARGSHLDKHSISGKCNSTSAVAMHSAHLHSSRSERSIHCFLQMEKNLPSHAISHYTVVAMSKGSQ